MSKAIRAATSLTVVTGTQSERRGICGYHPNRRATFIRVQPAYRRDTPPWHWGVMYVCDECHQKALAEQTQHQKKQKPALTTVADQVGEEEMNELLTIMRGEAA